MIHEMTWLAEHPFPNHRDIFVLKVHFSSFRRTEDCAFEAPEHRRFVEAFRDIQDSERSDDISCLSVILAAVDQIDEGGCPQAILI